MVRRMEAEKLLEATLIWISRETLTLCHVRLGEQMCRLAPSHHETCTIWSLIKDWKTPKRHAR